MKQLGLDRSKRDTGGGEKNVTPKRQEGQEKSSTKEDLVSFALEGPKMRKIKIPGKGDRLCRKKKKVWICKDLFYGGGRGSGVLGGHINLGNFWMVAVPGDIAKKNLKTKERDVFNDESFGKDIGRWPGCGGGC